MEWSEGGKWDNCNSIVNKYIFKKTSKLVNFNTEDGRKYITFLAYYALLFQER